MKMNQKDAVFAAYCAVFAVAHFDEQVVPTKEQRGQVNNILFEGFKSEKIAYDGALPTDSELKGYVSGLQSNWLRKDKRLNGGTQYVAKNPGSRAGSTDPTIKAMRLLLNSGRVTEASEITKIQGMIASRVAELKPAKSTVINVDDLPEELKHLAE